MHPGSEAQKGKMTVTRGKQAQVSVGCGKRLAAEKRGDVWSADEASTQPPSALAASSAADASSSEDGAPRAVGVPGKEDEAKERMGCPRVCGRLLVGNSGSELSREGCRSAEEVKAKPNPAGATASGACTGSFEARE